MNRFRFVALAALVVALLAQSASLAATQVINDALTEDDPTQASRVALNGDESTCDAPRIYPGEGLNPGNRHYDTHAVVNPHDVAMCVEVTLTGFSESDAFLAAAYLGSYDPLDLSKNYLADQGVADDDEPQSFSFVLGPGATAVIVVTSFGIDSFGSYSLEIVVPEPNYQACLYAGSLSQVSAVPQNVGADASCARGEPVLLTGGEDIFACLYGGVLSQVGFAKPGNCGRGKLVGFAAGSDLFGCLYAGSLSKVGSSSPASCGRGSSVGFDTTTVSGPYTATLSASNTVPPNPSAGIGQFSMVVIDGSEICFTLSFADIDSVATSVDIHLGPLGVNGPMAVALSALFGDSGQASGCVAVDPLIAAAIVANPEGYYVDIHSISVPNGEIRGQLVAGQ